MSLEAVMDDPETNGGRIRLPEDEEEQQTQSWKERTAVKLESRRFHSAVFTLIVIDCTIVILEICFTLLADCTDGGGDEGNRPQWLEILLYMSMVISVLFLCEIPVHAWAFGLRWYIPYPFGGGWESTFHFFDAVVIIMNFAIIFLQGPAQELAGLLILLRLWRLVKLLGGVAEGVEGLNRNIRLRLESCEKELASKTQQLEEANRKLDTLQRKLDATQP